MRKTSFGYDCDAAGALHFRENLPHKEPLWGFAAADGQMGQILHAYIDWRSLSGDTAWLREAYGRALRRPSNSVGYREAGMPTATV